MWENNTVTRSSSGTAHEQGLRTDTEGPASRSRRERPSSPKRARLMSTDMRFDSDNLSPTSNGTRYQPNGSPSLFGKSPAPPSTNGYSHTNGLTSHSTNGTFSTTTSEKPQTYYGHDREEVARLLMQCLNDLGYQDSANRLVQESGYELESPTVAAFRHAILEGEWSEAESLLFGSSRPQDGGGVSICNGNNTCNDGLVLATGVDRDELKFRLRKQKYLELLELRDHGSALMVLRQELTPLHQDVGQLHVLSGLVSISYPLQH